MAGSPCLLPAHGGYCSLNSVCSQQTATPTCGMVASKTDWSVLVLNYESILSLMIGMVTQGGATTVSTQGVLLSLHHLILHTPVLTPSTPLVKQVWALNVYTSFSLSFRYTLLSSVCSSTVIIISSTLL